jgi:O-antigen polymerase
MYVGSGIFMLGLCHQVRAGREKSGLTMPTKKEYFLSFLILILAATLVNSHLFPSAPLAAYFLYILLVSILALGCGLIFLSGNGQIGVGWSPALMFVLLWGLYVFGRGVLSGEPLSFHTVYIIGTCLFFFCVAAVLELVYPSMAVLLRAVVLLACCEAIVSIFQFVDLIPSANSYFQVTGSWVNPNVTAMFLAMSVPAVLYLLFSAGKTDRIFSVSALALITGSLFLLKCRTAIAGELAAAGMVLGYRFRLVQWLTGRRQRGLKLVLLAVVLAALATGGWAAYRFKQASADGRKLIWKISLEMVKDRPLTGVGYGRFEYEYNRRQAGYFEEERGSEEEKKYASYVHMAYNEFLESGVEGGIPGLLLFAGIILFLLFQNRAGGGAAANRGRTAGQRPATGGREEAGEGYVMILRGDADLMVVCRAAVAVFAFMSFFNFTLQAIPVTGLFVFYGSILSYQYARDRRERKGEEGLAPMRLNKAVTGVVLLLAGAWLIFTQPGIAAAQMELRQAERQIGRKHYRLAAGTLAKDGEILATSGGYWECLGKIAYMQKDYRSASDYLSRGRQYSSDPGLFILSGNCYEMQEQYDSAEKQYLIALNMEPDRLLPRYDLMNMYLKKGDTLRAVDRAAEILVIRPKVLSEKAEEYKEEADAVQRLRKR